LRGAGWARRRLARRRRRDVKIRLGHGHSRSPSPGRVRPGLGVTLGFTGFGAAAFAPDDRDEAENAVRGRGRTVPPGLRGGHNGSCLTSTALRTGSGGRLGLKRFVGGVCFARMWGGVVCRPLRGQGVLTGPVIRPRGWSYRGGTRRDHALVGERIDTSGPEFLDGPGFAALRGGRRVTDVPL